MPHRIRLRGPWQYEPLLRYRRLDDGQIETLTNDLPPAGKITMPADWSESLGADYRGQVRYTRRFTCPTGIEPGMRVVLVIDGVNHSARVLLDERPLGEIADTNTPWQCDIGEHLSERHLLCVIVDMPADAAESVGGLVGEVRLEIFEEEEA
jgi:beta-galactosidase/beta-glucuronidase